MSAFNHILSSGKVLSKNLAIILIFLTFLSEIRVVNSNDRWWFLFIHFIKLNFLKQHLGIVIFSFEAGNKPKMIRFNYSYDNNIYHTDSDDAES